MTPELVTFLTSCLDEDQRVAEAAAAGEWAADQSEHSAGRIEAAEPGKEWSMVIYDEGGHTAADAAHIVAWQPARVLAEIAAKRAILDRAFDEAAIGDGEKGCCHPAEEIRDGKCPAYRAITYLDFPLLFILAQPYRDRPGWRTEWERQT